MKYLRIIFTLGPRLLVYAHKLKKMVKHKERYSYEERYAYVRFVARVILSYLRPDYMIEGEEYFKEVTSREEKILIINNHESLMDALVLLALSEKPFSFIIKKEALKMPLVPWAVKAVDGIFIDREDLKQSLKVLIEVRERLKENKMNMLIYPEGTRNKEPETTPVMSFHAGTFKPVLTLKKEILVIASYGSFRLLSTKDPKRNPIWMKIFPLVTPDDYEGKNTNEIAEMCREMIDQEVSRFKDKDKEYFAKGYHKVKLKKGKLM